MRWRNTESTVRGERDRRSASRMDSKFTAAERFKAATAFI